LDDSDAEVRAHAAMGLARIADPRAIDALVRTIDDAPDVAHYPYTLSVYGLVDMGRRSLPTVAPLLKAADPNTRRRAFLVIRSVLEGLSEGSDWHQRWNSLGRYDPDGDQAERDRVADRWRVWIGELG
jgi:HEAT repeat protein